MTSRQTTYCPLVPPDLQGSISINFTALLNVSITTVATQVQGQAQGFWRPKSCVARHTVTIVIPYRDRESHLAILLKHLHPLLQRQQLDYTIVVVEQNGTEAFNKALLMNVGFVESQKLRPTQCVVFHDVDLVPEDDRNMYSCPPLPRHLSVAVDQMNYKLAYPELVGGVLGMRTAHFLKVNGYSNLYWGWGAEDDDMYFRLHTSGFRISRPPVTVARYSMIPHRKRSPADWRKRTKLLLTGTTRYMYDGLNSLTYRLIDVTHTPLYVHMLVDVGSPPKGFK